MRLHQTLEKYLPLIGNMLFPAFIFSFGLFAFLSQGEFEFSTASVFHWSFYALSLAALVILLNFNQSRPLFFMITVFLGYLFLNYLKSRFGQEIKTTVWYDNLSVIIPTNLLFFYYYQQKRFFCYQSIVILIILALEYTIGEFLGRYGWSLAFYYAEYNIVAILLFGTLVIISFIKAVKKGKLFDYSILFASLSVALGCYYCDTPSGVSIFFFMAQLILLIYLVYNLVYCHYYDELTGTYSRNSYLLQSKHFPLKYSLNIISIDNYDKLAVSIGRRHLDTITVMISEIIDEMIQEDVCYRYQADEFIIIYKKFDEKEAFAKSEEIRRKIAGLSFAYSTQAKPIKLTVSGSVAEKKRSDIGAVEVLRRAEEAMRKTLKFSHNVTSRA